MSYDYNWIIKNLGISRKTMDQYVKKKYIHLLPGVNPMAFDEENTIKLWYIKTFIGMGYSRYDIDECYNSKSDVDLIDKIDDRIIDMEKNMKELRVSYNLAKTIQATGRIPVIKEVGTLKYNEFINYIKENYSFYEDPIFRFEEYFKKEMSDEEREDFINKVIDNVFDKDNLLYINILENYFSMIVAFKDKEYDSDDVQRIVSLLCDALSNLDIVKSYNSENGSSISVSKFSIVGYFDGLILEPYIEKYGEDGVLFIKKALYYFDGESCADELEWLNGKN